MESQTRPGRDEKNTLRELLEQKQTHLDEVLRDLYPDIEMMNLQLEMLAASDESDNSDEIEAFANEAVRSLDVRWPFYGDQVHVSGNWLVSEVTISPSSIEFSMKPEPAFNIIQSNGFALHNPRDDTPPRIGLSFMYQNMAFMDSAIQGNLTKLAFADIGSVTVNYIQPTDKESLMGDISDLRSQIVLYDQLLMMHYHDSNSEFFRKSARQQLDFLTRLTDSVSDSMPSPQNGYKAFCEQVTVPYVYRRITDGTGEKWQKVGSEDHQSVLLSGPIDGVGVLESVGLLHNNPLRGKNELVDPDAGICLIVQVDQVSIPDIFNNQPVYVPMRLAQEFEIIEP